MKKAVTTILGTLFFLSFQCLYAQNVSIPDTVFLHALIEKGYDLNNDSLIQESEALLVTDLSLTSAGITNFTGLSSFTNLTRLDIYGNMRNLPGALDVSALTKLTYLNAKFNYLTSINVSGLTSLDSLNIGDNSLTAVDLSGLTSLKYLYATHNDIKSFDASTIPSVEIFYMHYNNLSSFDATPLVNAKIVAVSSNNNLSSINVAGMTNLEKLYCGVSKVSTIDLTGLENVYLLNIADAKMEEIDLSPLSSLTHLYLGKNKFQKVDLSTQTKLEYLSLGYENEIDTLDVSGLSALADLSAPFVSLKTVIFEDNTALNKISLNDNNIESIDLSGAPNVTRLSINTNSISSLDLNQVVNLETLNAGENDFEFLDVSMLQSLESLNVDDCAKLTCLSHLPEYLTSLSIDATAIKCVSNVPDSLQAILDANPDDFFVQLFYALPVPVCNPTNNENSCPTFPQVMGNVYTDLDLNQEKDDTEFGYQGVQINLSPSNKTIYTDADGNYATTLKDTGAYVLTIESPLYYDAVPTEINGHTSTFEEIDTSNVALQVNTTANDLVIEISSFSRARPGFDMYYYVDYWNKGTEALNNVAVKFVMPSAFILNDTTMVPNINNDTLTYLIGSLAPGEHGEIYIAGTTELDALGLDQEVTASVYDLVVVNDTDVSNNYDTISYTVTGSYDPNDKLAVESITPQEVQQGFDLEYRIRFQNSGTDTAFTVVVTDTLSPLLDLSTLEIISSSHTMKPTLDNNVLVMTFDNILLPDSNVNEPMSHGYIFYKIQPLKTLVEGDQILNTANIYFDFNEPIITNTVVTKVETPSVITNMYNGIESNTIIYPNPTTGILNLSFENQPNTVQIVNAMGVKQEIKWLSSQVISVEHLPLGTYFLQTITHGKVENTLFILQD